MENESNSGWSALSTGAKAGIIVAAVVAVGLLIWLLVRSTGGGDETAAVPTATLEATLAPELSTPGATPGDSTDTDTDSGIIIVIPTPEPGDPTVTAVSPTNIRGGPGLDYPIIGLLNQNESAEAIGISDDGLWFAIRIPQTPQGSGWIYGPLVTGSNVSGLPIIAAPPLPAPTAAPPVVITDWRGEYFDNRDLRGEPVLVRNDAAIDFSWSTGSPAPEVPADNFSARWSIQRNAPAGIYRFSVWVDDGVRLFVNGTLLINGWSQGPARNYTAQIELQDGSHEVVVEYFEATGTALINVDVGYEGPAATVPPRARINGPLQGVVGEELTFDGTASVPADNSSITNYQWTFSDGTVVTGERVTHVYNRAGVYNVTLVVTDANGLTGSSTIQVRIDEATVEPTPAPTATPTPAPTQPAAPVPGFIVTPQRLVVGQPVTFDASMTTSTAPVVTYAWDFGDGTVGEGVQVEHTYATDGAYTVTLSVTDQNNVTGQASLPVTVAPADEAAPEPTAAPETEATPDGEPTPEGDAVPEGDATPETEAPSDTEEEATPAPTE